MRKLVLAVVALVAMSLVTVPSALAQEAEKADAEKKMEKAEKMEKKAGEAHWMEGTMTPPDQESMDIEYAFKKTEDGPQGWIVVDADGETTKVEMKDLTWDDDHVSYNWSPPSDAGTVISCNLMKQDDGGWAGDCTDNGEEGRTGQMTIAAI